MKNEWQLTLPTLTVTFPEPISEQDALRQVVQRLGARMPGEAQGLVAFQSGIRSVEVDWPESPDPV